MNISEKKIITQNWFKSLRDAICSEFEQIEEEYKKTNSLNENAGKFSRKSWQREGGGGGEMSVMKGLVFEKVGVNISTVHGQFSEEFRKQIPGCEKSAEFFATGISLVAHMQSPLVPAVHMNTRFIVTKKNWFGGGADLNPIFENKIDSEEFHTSFKKTCENYQKGSYDKYKKDCDDYFFIKHRNIPRGVGGIFYDYLNSNDFDKDFEFTRNVGQTFLDIYPKIVRRNMLKSWTAEQREAQLIKRGYYTEFNLIYDRGTKFGLMTNGNTEAILMSLPPVAKWN